MRETRAAIVVGLDRSEQGRAAVDYAAALAARRGARLRVVHAYESSQYMVRPIPGWRPDGFGLMRTAAEGLMTETTDVLAVAHPDLVVETRLEPGGAVAALLDESEHAHVVVLGSRGTGGFVDLLIGSTTLHVASRAHCPVIAIPATPVGEPAPRGVVVGVDNSESSQHALDVALQGAAESGERVTAVYAYDDPMMLGVELILPLAKLEMAEAMAGWAEKYPDVAITRKLIKGHAVHALITESRHASLLVVGSRGRGSVRSLLGSVSHGVLHHAKGPVEVVHRSD